MDRPVNAAQGPQRAWRLVCTTDAAGQVRVRSRRRVEMIVPSTGPLAEASPATGFWVELRDAEERTRYRRAMPDPLEAEIEVPAEPGGEGFAHVRAPGRRTFSVLVPDIEGADHVALVRGGRTRRAGAPRVEEIARLPLTEEPR